MLDQRHSMAVSWVFVGVTLSLLLSGCALFDRWRGPDDALSVTELADPVPASEYRAHLTDKVAAQLDSAQADSGPASAELVSKRPYYYKEYVEYPSSPDDFEMDFTERDSRTAPYAAEVTYDKIRYSTRLHRNRDAARADSDFLRDTGRERVSYELRNGEWRKIGSFFVADQTEELVGGEWVQVDEQAVRTIASERSDRGWLRRTWDAIRFWR